MSHNRRLAWYASGFALLCVFAAWANSIDSLWEEQKEEDTGFLPSDDAYAAAWDTASPEDDTGLSEPESLMAVGAYVGLARGRTGARWRAGTLDGEVKSSNPNPDDYYADYGAYSAIDTRQMGRTSSSFGLGVFGLFIPRVSDLVNLTFSVPQPSQWDDLADLMTDKYSAPTDTGDPDSGDFPEIIAAHLEEPKGEELDTADPTAIELWETDYRGEDTGGHNFDFKVLEELDAAMTVDANGRTENPEAIILDELENWAQVAHEPLGDRVPVSEVTALIEAIHTMETSSVYTDKPVEAWLYISEKGIVQVGLESWVMGDEVVAEDAPRTSLLTGQEVGFSFATSCPPGTQEFHLSFLHYDTYATDNGSDATDGSNLEDLRLHIYVNGTQVGTGDPNYYGSPDPYGGFRFYDEDRTAMVDLVRSGNFASTALCTGSHFTIKIVAQCHAPDGTCDECASTDATCISSEEGAGPGKNKGYISDLWTKKVVPIFPATLPPTYQTLEGRVNLSSGLTVVRPAGYTMLQSMPNTSYRHLFKGGSATALLDSVIVRYGHGQDGECPGTTLYSHCMASQARLMKAVGHAVGPYDTNRSFNYFETNSWQKDWDKTWFVDMLGNTEAYTDGMIGGRYPLANWEIEEGDGEYYSEHAIRDGIRPYLDENFSFDQYDDYDYYSHFFFHTSERDEDAVPGFYQRYTTSEPFDFAAELDEPVELSFEIAQWGCVGCGLITNTDEETRPDTVIEFAWKRTDVVPNEEGSEIFVMEDIEENPYAMMGDDPLSDFYWEATEGRWEFAVTLYTIDRPYGARHGFFRLFDSYDPLSSPTYGHTYELPDGWNYSSGLWTEDTTDPHYLPLSYSLGHYNSAVDEDASAQAIDIQSCLWAFWLDAPAPVTPWDTFCPTLF